MCISRHGYYTRRLLDVDEVLECLPLRFDVWKMSSYASGSVGRRLPLHLKAVEYAWSRTDINDHTGSDLVVITRSQKLKEFIESEQNLTNTDLFSNR